MYKQNFRFYLVLAIILGRISSSITHDDSKEKIYSNKWVVLIEGGLDEANRLAAKHGFRNLGQVGSLEGFYHFQHDAHPQRSKRSVEERTDRLSEEQLVQFAEQQIIKRRVKRDIYFKDPLFPKQWFLKNTDHVFHDYDHNILPVWKKGITGKGVVVSILDDGIEHTHKDLAANYDALASYDYNSNDADPMPRTTWNDENRHGTRCAGEVAAVANNSICGVGAAPGAKVGGVRMLDGDVTDAVEASSLSLQPQHIDIYSSSWGPDDDGRTVDGPAKLAKKAFTDGILHGRGGLGSIYVWASGNGGRQKDSCNCDGYTNSIYTLSISSASEHGTSPWYSEYCSSTLATTYSSGDYNQRKIVTTDLHGKCTESHTGTSASAPLAAGILALVLEANPRLTWRDMQHIVVRTSKVDRLTSDDFVTNGVGRKVSHKFGYGLLDAAALVDLAARWKTVPAQHICSEIPDATQRTIPGSGMLRVQMKTNACKGTANYVRYLEHVEAVISLKYSRRGDLTIYLTSPKGTKSTLLARRPSDGSSQGFNNWPFMSTHSWEEDPTGTWTLEIENKGSVVNTGVVRHWSLVFHGTSQAPFKDENEKEAIPACSVECDGGCTGPSAAECRKCKHYRQETTKDCVASCASNEFVNQKTCQLCNTACATCNGSTTNDCLSCHSPLVLQQGKCATMCTEGWYKVMEGSLAVCKICDENCLTCAGHAKQCTSCKPSRKLSTNRCECAVNEYRVADLCRPCHPSCLSCSGPGESACTRCGTKANELEKGNSKNVTLFLHSGECTSICHHGFYGDAADHKCKKCNKDCSTCVGPLNNQCLVCSHGLFRDGSPTGRCVSTCPKGHYGDPAQLVCKLCNSLCLSCETTDPGRCTACDEGRFLSENKCLTPNECPKGTYPNATLKECDQCYKSCLNCSGKTQQQCTACLEGFHLFSSQCLLKCPDGTFPDETGKCLHCHADCHTCYGKGQSQCLSCQAPKFLFQSRCVTQCPGGTFSDHELQQCVTCDVTCASCSGPSPEQCTACKDSWTLNGSKCIQPCKKGGQYMDTTGCHDCDSSCVTCIGPTKTNCTSCQGVKFLDTLTQLCSYECPSGYYGEEHSGMCKSCSPGCKLCHGPSNCKSCNAGLVLVSKHCQNHCPSGTYKTPTNTCEPCHVSCEECNSSPTQCIKCKDHEMLSEQTCVAVCPKGTFLEESAKKCFKCDQSCEECSGPLSNECTKCNKTSVKVGSRCLKECPAQYYYNRATEQCQPCDYYCHTCEGGNGRVNCTNCVQPFVLHKHYCVRACPRENWFHDGKQRKCIACHSSCRKCIGPTEHDCISCSDPLSALMGFTCRAKCPNKMFHNKQTGLCEKCHPTCKTCTGSGKQNCKDCVKGLVLDKKSGECKSVCPAEQFSSSGKCFSCNVACKTCNGPNDDNCLSCKQSYFLYNQTCVKTCPEKLYGDLLKRRCLSCHPVCRACNGASSFNCLSCTAPLYLQNTSCVLSCSPNHFADKESRVCKSCVRDCPNAFRQSHERSVYDANADKFDFFFRDPHQTGITTFLALSVLAAIVLFLVVFGILQIQSYKKYRKYRVLENGDSNANFNKKLSIDDLEPEDDVDSHI